MNAPIPQVLRLFKHSTPCADFLAEFSAGSSIPARIAMMAIWLRSVLGFYLLILAYFSEMFSCFLENPVADFWTYRIKCRNEDVVRFDGALWKSIVKLFEQQNAIWSMVQGSIPVRGATLPVIVRSRSHRPDFLPSLFVADFQGFSYIPAKRRILCLHIPRHQIRRFTARFSVCRVSRTHRFQN